MATLLVTGGAGFIGSALIRMIVRDTAYDVVNVDKLTYAGSLEAVADVSGSDRYHFERVDVCDAQAVRKLFDLHQPAGVIHLAAETHVDRSIDGPPVFVQTNVVGTFTLLQEALHYWRALRGRAQRDFRFVHVSTDEVFGSLGPDGRFHEGTPYAPRSPYAASKASADHLARAWFYTYGLPVMTTNCSNNYGPFQYPEKLMPLMIQKAVVGAQLPVYGSGENIRDWLFVDDHARALLLALERGTPGETYNVGADNERTNLDVVRSICDLVNELAPDDVIGDRHRLVTFVADRPGHDERYAIDASRIRSELGWMPRESFASGLRTTVEWYLANQCWCERVQSGRYAGERLGVAEHAR